MITATTPTTQRVPSIELFNPSRRASTDARQLTHVPDGGGAPFPPSVLVIPAPLLASMRSSCWRSVFTCCRSISREILLTACAHEAQKCLNMFQTLRPSLTCCNQIFIHIVLQLLILSEREFDQSVVYLVYSCDKREESSSNCCCL